MAYHSAADTELKFTLRARDKRVEVRLDSSLLRSRKPRSHFLEATNLVCAMPKSLAMPLAMEGSWATGTGQCRSHRKSSCSVSMRSTSRGRAVGRPPPSRFGWKPRLRLRSVSLFTPYLRAAARRGSPLARASSAFCSCLALISLAEGLCVGGWRGSWGSQRRTEEGADMGAVSLEQKLVHESMAWNHVDARVDGGRGQRPAAPPQPLPKALCFFCCLYLGLSTIRGLGGRPAASAAAAAS